MLMKAVNTLHAPQPIGPYAQAVISNGLLFVSGQIGLDPASNEMAGEDIKHQTDQVLANLAAILEQAGSSPEKLSRRPSSWLIWLILLSSMVCMVIFSVTTSPPGPPSKWQGCPDPPGSKSNWWPRSDFADKQTVHQTRRQIDRS